MILNKTSCLFTKKITQQERRSFLFITNEFEDDSLAIRDTLAREKKSLPDENVAQESSEDK